MANRTPYSTLRHRALIAFVGSVAAGWACPSLADEVPSLDTLEKEWATLQENVQQVQGTFRTYRIEKPLPEALTKNPEEIEIPVVREGHLWRDGKRFRADYSSHDNRNQPGEKVQHSLAMDGKRVFAYSYVEGSKIGMLRVSTAGSAEAKSMVNTINHSFLHSLDALWSIDGKPWAEYHQQPGVRLTAGGANSKDRFSMRHAPVQHAQTTAEFYQEKPFPFLSLEATDQAVGNLNVTVQERVTHTPSGKLRPTRVVQVVTLPEQKGYTEVTELNLEPLAKDSPLKEPTTPASFQDLGGDYQVYHVNEQGKEALGERIEGKSPAE